MNEPNHKLNRNVSLTKSNDPENNIMSHDLRDVQKAQADNEGQ